MIRRYLARRKMRWAVRFHRNRPDTVAVWIVKKWGLAELLRFMQRPGFPLRILKTPKYPDDRASLCSWRELAEYKATWPS